MISGFSKQVGGVRGFRRSEDTTYEIGFRYGTLSEMTRRDLLDLKYMVESALEHADETLNPPNR